MDPSRELIERLADMERQLAAAMNRIRFLEDIVDSNSWEFLRD